MLPRRHVVLTGLLCSNVCLAFGLIAMQDPNVDETPALAPLEAQLKLIEEPALVANQAPAAIKECRVWGPESDPDTFAPLQSELDQIGGFPEIIEMQVAGKPDYLVYVANLGSRDNAKRVASELRSQDIESYLINRDDGSRILSVGVFSRKRLADRQLQKVTDLGYAGQVDELPRAQTVYNLTAHVELDSQLYKTSTSACMAFAQNN